MSQPQWKCIANLGDVSPVDYGGYFIYIDETGVYPPEGEVLISPDDDDAPEGWIVYRFILDRCTYINGVLSDNQFHPEHSAWFANASRKGDKYTVCGDLASFAGIDATELIQMFCSDNPIERAQAYRAVGDYHGFENLDSYPLTFHDRAEVEARYAADIDAMEAR